MVNPRHVRELYNIFSIDPSIDNHRPLARVMYKVLTGTNLTATLRHVKTLDNNSIGRYLHEEQECLVVDWLPHDRILTTMGHELGHARHNTGWRSVYEETKTELFEVLYTKKLEELIDKQFDYWIGEESPLYPHMQDLPLFNSEKLADMYYNFDRTNKQLSLGVRKPLIARLGI